jgi:membrane protease YdiL (CAAX protease family)
MKPLERLRLYLFDKKLEPFLITGGLYAFTALYYTRTLVLQVLSLIVLIGTIIYWVHIIRREPAMTWRDFKLTKDKWWLHTLIAIFIAVFGWYYFSLYNKWTRGKPLTLGYGGSISVILSAITVSIAEEVYFRGYLQNSLSSKYSIWVRVLIAVAALAFYKNVVHLWQGMSFLLHLELFLIGVLHNVLASLWMEWSGSLIGPIVLHVVWDLLVYAPLTSVPYWII